MQKKPVYITTTLPYVNAKPHVGFAMEIVRADALARFYAMVGHSVFFNTGTDEHGQKIYQKAQELGIDTQAYVDELAESFKGLVPLLNLSDDIHFIRTTDKHHKQAAQEMWKRCFDNGYIYKKTFSGDYCVGCELFIPEKDQVDGCCPIHKKPLDQVSEENYFFKFSAFTDQLDKIYQNQNDFVTPGFRFNEIKAFVDRGLEDFSISRLKTKMPWGVPVPGDDDHVMYVWFDALTNYISTLGWPDEDGDFATFWRDGITIQYAGKDNLRQQSAMWQAMLLAAGISMTDHIVINGFINSGGQKMSKSLGNVISPYDIVETYGSDALRYYLLRHLSSFEDSDMTMDKFHESYTAHLVNGVGNLTNRVLKMAERALPDGYTPAPVAVNEQWQKHFQDFDIQKATELVWKKVGELDAYITEHEPFKVVKEDPEKAAGMLRHLVDGLSWIAYHLKPLLPETAKRMDEAITALQKPEAPLFGRVERET